VDLDAATIIAVGDAMEAHVRDAFAWEAAKAREINNATTQAELDAAKQAIAQELKEAEEKGTPKDE